MQPGRECIRKYQGRASFCEKRADKEREIHHEITHYGRETESAQEGEDSCFFVSCSFWRFFSHPSCDQFSGRMDGCTECSTATLLFPAIPGTFSPYLSNRLAAPLA